MTITITLPPDTPIQPTLRALEADLAKLAQATDCRAHRVHEQGRVSYELVKRQEVAV